MEKYPSNRQDTEGETRLISPGFSAKQPDSGAETVVLKPKKEASILAWLIEKEGRRPGTVYQLNEGITSIGRREDNDIVLDDPAVSREHAKIRIEEGKFVLYDLVSENGTFVNGERIANKEIVDNDEIIIGETVLVFRKI